ncbi:GTP cyclohydrolase II [Candidatus Nomurabacteria bacterium RIFCSPHIGHO2_02_FULL_42_19]|uniref:GTP cyclohydrolase-2 n=1 Tax=Candidatus Nomurabacteria bacterium RIFCSPHIGHO2_02_FULL_42_19 TaxID=1801756 RepID=A0A1F6W3N5_9BACT|nr:MAG: GTP cyclohydrolase II [Candidatus Nomurabacteria bacterium RIFCSPHIGHO2_02_FULL_42_19]
MNNKKLINREVAVKLPTKYGDFILYAYSVMDTGEKHLALVKGKWKKGETILTRLHSSCMTGDIFGSLRCDCGPQLAEAMGVIEKEGKGVLVYLNQEGRGIGLVNKLKAYKLQENGSDTVEANLELGFKMDERDYKVGAEILENLGISKIRLLTNNPAKQKGLTNYGIEILENIPIQIKSNKYNKQYLLTKRDKMKHTLNLE